jgi:hypothetical protein
MQTTAQFAEAAAEAIDQNVAHVFCDGQIRQTQTGHSFDVEVGGQIFKVEVTEYAAGQAADSETEWGHSSGYAPGYGPADEAAWDAHTEQANR